MFAARVLVCRCLANTSKRAFSERTTHFGFETVTEDEKAHKVKEVFSKVADKYDLMNDVMSAGVHRVWKNYFIDQLNPMPGSSLLDVAGGTGDIAFRFMDKVNCQGLSTIDTKSKVTVFDINANMLQVGEKRAEDLGYTKHPNCTINFVVGDAQQLPFPENTFDLYTIAFGIRNVVDIEAALVEAHRVLKPGGCFSCLEFSKVENALLEKVYDWYSFNLIPVYGELLAGDWKSYQYLVESIRKFPDQDDFKEMIVESGFKLVHYENLTAGVAAIHIGFKSIE